MASEPPKFDPPPVGSSLQERAERVYYAVFGFNGDGGLRRRVEKLEEGRENDLKERISSQRAVLLALFAAIVALIGTVASLAVLVSQ